MRKNEPSTPEKLTHLDRREFLTAGGAGLIAAAVPATPLQLQQHSGTAVAHSALSAMRQAASGAKRKIPIGVFDPVYEKLTLDQMIDKISALGLEAVEIGTGGYPANSHCPIDELLADPAKAKAWQKKFTDKGLRVGTLGGHGIPLHPNAAMRLRTRTRFERRCGWRRCWM